MKTGNKEATCIVVAQDSVQRGKHNKNTDMRLALTWWIIKNVQWLLMKGSDWETGKGTQYIAILTNEAIEDKILLLT